MKNISILGVTGSIGKSTLKIIDNFSDELNLIAISVNRQIRELLSIIDKYKPKYAVVFNEHEMQSFFNSKETVYNGVSIYSGNKGLEKVCSDRENDLILNGISGKAGLIPSLKIVENGIDLALANKESMVCAGKILNTLSQKNNCKIIPVDSEHSAVFQLLQNHDKESVKNIYLTASGGPFWRLDKNRWGEITIEDALNHPTWKMGTKITIDSATMANKGLEVIEANELFGFDYSQIKVLIHPQSLIHSMIECVDGELYAQIGPKDMSLPIMNAIFYPKFKNNAFNNLDFSKAINLELIPVDFDKFKMLSLAYHCGKKGGMFPTFYNTVNELLVELFLAGRISFLKIETYTEKGLEIFEKNNNIDKKTISIENIKLIEKESERIINEIMGNV
ncbi:MAG: 1-deoxy-D-xylulose-5-phosphate reductoisomerase [Spirochaetes bacterium GWD1_27_9]|nr:MAG: 1-deoxy-D-xylulose-5-phosphate reductoisomerase [Spirochaetes bacterium GWB1_27_13]OHD22110.1 MAG: 1-deoxy-D-xylulose-5-phosphate reductoisomerase [Spirochaetes bacterium GWC1_27_15]OHD28955.1 MAG: 1-deoxy-D-xylulose-5-phosphate reductoisomerase [Spirochaetes bacterium GWD1_27_9]